MKFIAINSLEEDMILARDLHMLNSKNEVLLLTKKMRLTTQYIKQLKAMGISGAFICDGVDDDLDMDNLLTHEEKKKAVREIKELFDKYDMGQGIVTKEDIASMREIARSIVEAVLAHKEVEIGVIELKSYDDYTFHHCLSVCVISVAIASAMAFSKEELIDLGLAGLLHDVGKTMVDIKLINKPGKLTNIEYQEVSKHALLGGNYLLEHDLVNENIYNGVISHHEKYDGTGYPFHLKEDAIPLFARIIAVADVYDALTSNRPYRKAKTPTEAFEIILGSSTTHFDANIVDAFTKKIAPYPVGSSVRLSNADVGIVIRTSQEFPLRPLVRSIYSGKNYDLLSEECMNIVIENNVEESSL